MEELSDRFVYFSLQSDGNIKFNENNESTGEFILPRHPETNDLDVYYLQSMLKYFDPSKDIVEVEILDAFPVISLTKDKNNKFYKLSLYRLREFYKNQIEEDEYIQASVKHLFMYSLLANPTNKTLKRVINACLDRVTPVMYRRDQGDTVDCDNYELHCLASYVPTSRYRIMKLLRGWIEGALHFYDYSIMFFDYRFVGFDDFNENIIDIKIEDLFEVEPYLMSERMYIPIETSGSVTLHESGLYYDMNLKVSDVKGEWLFTSPNNDNERDGKVMMFRNKDLQARLEEILTSLFRKDSFRLNEVFKWNRYSRGGKFNTHFDTMFVDKSSEECSLYTLLMYFDVKGDSYMYLSGEQEVQVRLESDKVYIIPHWVKHRVEGEDAREFIKTEIVFKNKCAETTYDQTLADAFDESCYYMLQSVRHPELKDIVSQNFNTINEARFYKTKYVPKLINNIFFIKTLHNLPLECSNKLNDRLMKTSDLKFNFITDGTHYYFKIKHNSDKSKPDVSRNEAVVMLSVMQLDIQPKKMFKRKTVRCECYHINTDFSYTSTDFDIDESISYWNTDERDAKIADVLQCIELPPAVGNIHSIGNISLKDINNNPAFYFAGCRNEHLVHTMNYSIITEITSKVSKGNYASLNVEFVGDQKNIIKIRQQSFKNGIVIKRIWY